jgi:phosphoribosyl 1,2-cyclic phosphodiesterase
MATAPSVPARLKLWGVRGSIPVPGRSTLRYGGNTTCLELRADGEIIILDAGTGIRGLGAALEEEFGDKPIEVSLLITHMHWDHIQGFPFFSPSYRAKNRIRVMGYDTAHASLRETFAGQMADPFFPVQLQSLPGRIEIEEIAKNDFQIGQVRVRTLLMNHPGVCVGYRIDCSSGSLAFLPDTEPYEGRKVHSPDGENLSPEQIETVSKERRAELIDFLRDCELLIVDTQYTDEEYEEHVGWGHSSLGATLRLALDAQVRKLILFHHDPTHDDVQMDDIAKKAEELAAKSGTGLRVQAATEGSVFEL